MTSPADGLAERTRQALSLLEKDPEEAKGLAERNCEAASGLGDDAALAQNRYVIGSALSEKGDYEAAEPQLRQSLELAQSLGETELAVRVLRMLLKCAFFTRKWEAALLRGLQALSLARQSGNGAGEALAHNDLGLIYGNLGDFEGALEHLLAGLRIQRESGATKLASLLNNIGNVHLELGDHREALNFFRSSLEAFRSEGGVRGEGIALGNIGRACSGLGRHTEALEAYQQSLASFEARRDETYGTPALARLAGGLAAMERIAEARQAFDTAFARLESSEYREFEDEILAAAGRFHIANREPDLAIPLLLRALELVPGDETTRRLYELHEALADAYGTSGDLASALHHHKLFHQVRLAVSDSAISVRIRGLMLQFDVEQARQQEEIFRLRNVELAAANEQLQALQAVLEERNRELQQISIEDALTGLYNRRYLASQLEVQMRRALRHQRPLCVAMCDLDRFKSINDRYSHALGDDVLRQTAALFRETVRTTDLVARYGGEEFLVILPDTDLQGAHTLAERIRERISSHDWSGTLAEGLQVTISIGVAQLEPGAEIGDLLERADRRLYEAKRAGRDRVEL